MVMIRVIQGFQDVYGNRCEVIMRMGRGGREIEAKRKNCKTIDEDGYK